MTGDMPATVRRLRDTSFGLERRDQAPSGSYGAADVGPGCGGRCGVPHLRPSGTLERGGCLCGRCWPRTQACARGAPARGGLRRRPGLWSGAPDAPSQP